MIRLNEKGFAVSTILYGILTLTILLLMLILGVMKSNKDMNAGLTESLTSSLDKCAYVESQLEDCYFKGNGTCQNELNTYKNCFAGNNDNLDNDETTPDDSMDLTKLSDRILADNTVQSDSKIDFSQISSATNGQGLYRTTQDPLRLGDSYYFRGDNTLNNFVKFGKYPANTTINGTKYTTAKDIYWRIIRINEDGNIRLLYAGVDPNSTSDDLIGYGPFNNSLPYIGNDNLRYNYGALTSDLKYALDNWYQSYMLSYASYIGDSTFCNDMAISSGSGFEEEYTEYAAYNRLLGFVGMIITPTYSCNENFVQEQDSVYTVANGNLTYPVGTVTADELVYAGATYNARASNTTYFHVDTNFWTMTPLYFSWAMVGPGVASYHYDNWNALWEDNAAEMSLGYRPVINLKSTVTLSSTNPSGCSSQNGSASCPYIIN